jgi:hypothetical protein
METLMMPKHAEFPLHNRFMCEGVDVWITHIGGYRKYNPAIKAEMANPQIIYLWAFAYFESDV